MNINIDLHIHTKFSGDSRISPKIIIEQLHSHPIIKGIAITDHDTTTGFKYVQELAIPYRDIIVIPGIEITTLQGHLIILGIEEEPKRPLTIWEAVDFGMEQGGVIIIPHPFRVGGIAEIAEELNAHAVEVYNPHAADEENNQALKLAKIRGLAKTAGSDCHHIDGMWTAYTEIDAEPAVDSILNAIKLGKTKPHKLGPAP